MVKGYVHKNRPGHYKWSCVCDCGNKTIVFGYNLKNSTTQSCGCFQLDRTKASNTTHGHRINKKSSRAYGIWNNMCRRCYDPKHIGYQYYGERGIIVCLSWKKFEIFLQDVGSPPTIYHGLDRIDTNGNYCKTNCRWATSTTNNRNKRNNRLITFHGKTQCVSAWAEETGISKHTIKYRLNNGWRIEEILTTPVRERKR